MNRFQVALLLGALVTTSCEFPEPKPFFCGRSGFEVRDEQPSGDVRLRAWLHQADAEPGTVSIGYSLDQGLSWYPATIEGETQGLETSDDGVRVDFVWDSVADLGQGVFEDVSLRIAGYSACGAWDVGQVDGVRVDNSAAPDDGCTVSVDTPSSPEDGPIVLEYTLVHPEGLPAYVAPSWSKDGGETWSPLTTIDGDCDGDGVDDGLSDLTTSLEGVAHCLAWDSQLDFASDEEVLVQLSCGVGYSEDSTATTDAFTVENDPTPGPDEVIITEIQPDYASSGDYVELYNRTDHILNLNGVDLMRWKGAIEDTETPKTFTFSDPSGTVLLYPGDYLLVAETDDEGANGCLEPDVLWGEDFSLSADSQIQLQLDGEVLTWLDFQETSGRTATWEFEEGVSIGINPNRMGSDSWTDFDNWCAQTSTIASCEDYDDELGLGTPGAENDPCP